MIGEAILPPNRIGIVTVEGEPKKAQSFARIVMMEL